VRERYKTKEQQKRYFASKKEVEIRQNTTCTVLVFQGKITTKNAVFLAWISSSEMLVLPFGQNL
jgi:hypothetical protein